MKIGAKMINIQPGIVLGYLVSGGTSATGATQLIKQQIQVQQPHLLLGISISEWALLIGIIGTCVTMLFQYMNFRHNKRVRRDAFSALIEESRQALRERDAVLSEMEDEQTEDNS